MDFCCPIFPRMLVVMVIMTMVVMPALSATMTIGTISKWNLEAGEPFVAGDVLCESSVMTARLNADRRNVDEPYRGII